MSTSIHLFRGSDTRLFATVPLIGLLRLSLRGILGRLDEDARVFLYLLPYPDDDPPGGPPAVRNRMPDYGYATVEVHEGRPGAERVIYRHPHTIEELIAQPLRAVAASLDPNEKEWGFAFAGLDLPPREVTIPEPPVKGAASVTPYFDGEQPPFRIRRLPDPPLPPGRLADFGLAPNDNTRSATTKVLLAEGVSDYLLRDRPFSTEVEEGGFLVGRVYADSDTPDTHLVEVTAAPAAEYTGASLLHLTFTGDSFEAVKRLLRDSRPGERLLGWYHTHLFAAGEGEALGLSTIDLRLHFTTFRMPWQLAGLVNLYQGQRTLRFYVRQGDTMTLCPQWVLRDRR